MPLYGNELGPDITPFDAGLGRVVKLGKPGDFVGRAALAASARRPRRGGCWPGCVGGTTAGAPARLRRALGRQPSAGR